MPKMRKTRKEKMLADQRHTTYTYSPIPSANSERAATATKTHANPTTSLPHTPTHTKVVTSDYKYISGDLLKTIILTSAIIVAEILIKQLTFNH